MSRVSELTFLLLDGAMGEAERRELERLVTADEGAAREHIALMELEGALRAEQPTDVTRETMQRIADIAGSTTGERVMDRIKQQPRPAWKKSGIQKPVTGSSARVSGMQPKVSTRRGRARRATPASFAPWMGIAAAVALIAGVALFLSRSQSNTTVEAVATLTSVGTDARILRDGRSVQPVAGETLLANDQLNAGNSTVARIEYGDGSAVELSAKASALLQDASANASKQLRLTQGSLSARVAKQSGKPFVLSTPHATATVIGTQFVLAVDASSTRLDVNEGSVRIERASDAKSIIVDGGFFAVAGANQELVARKIGSDAVVVAPPVETKPAPPVPAEPALPAFGIVAFHLVDTSNSEPIRGFSPLQDGAVLELRTLPKGLTLTVKTNPKEVAKIIFDVDGKKNFKDEVDPPYSLSTNWIDKASGQDKFVPWTLGVGKHTVTATPYDSTKGNAKAGTALTVHFEIVK